MHFQSQYCEYLIHLDREAALAPTPVLTSYTCWRVPHHLQQLDWSELIDADAAQQLQHQLLLLLRNCKGMEVLSKVESPDYIHAYLVVPSAGRGNTAAEPEIPQQQGDGALGSAAVMWSELARYGLEFELRDGQLVSCDYQGYTLRPQPQLLNVVRTPAAADTEGENEYADNMSASSSTSVASMSTNSSTTSISGSSKMSISTVRSGSSSVIPSKEALDGVKAGAFEVLYTLPEFQQYLVLERIDSTGVVLGAGMADTLVLVPATETGVQLSSCGKAVMELPQGIGAKLKVSSPRYRKLRGISYDTTCASSSFQTLLCSRQLFRHIEMVGCSLCNTEKTGICCYL